MIVYGKQIFFYILEKHNYLINHIYLAKEIDNKSFKNILKLGKKIIKLDSKKAQAMSRGGNHQGFLLDIKPINLSNLNEIKEFNFILVLVNITDIGNIGAIIRTAYALGVEAVIISGLKNLKLEAIARSSSGAIFDIPIVLYRETLSLINELKQSNFYLYGADMGGEDINKIEIVKSKKALFLGSEGEGLSNRVKSKMDKIVAIKMEREFESLNVSVSAGIFCDRMR